MMVVGMLFAVLVLGPLLILAMLAAASNERAAAWLRRVTSQFKDGACANMPPPDIRLPTAHPAPDTPPDDTVNAACDPTQQTAW